MNCFKSSEKKSFFFIENQKGCFKKSEEQGLFFFNQKQVLHLPSADCGEAYAQNNVL